jgi:peptidoglycan/LPS O-acetylase OafA/YrhL
MLPADRVLHTEPPHRDTADATVGTDSRANGITALRLGLALWVLVMHAWPAGGFGADPLTWVTDGRVNGGGSVAVWAFFGLSGFLLASSRQRLPVYAFAWRRALRILPAYWVCIALTAGLVGWWYVEATLNPLGWIGGQRWVGFAANPTDLVNASLWTLPLEIACYIALALVPGRAVRFTAILLAVLLTATAASGWAFGLWLPPVFAFMIGLLLATWRVPIRGPQAFAAATLAFVVVGSPLGTLVAAAGLVYAMLWLAMWLPVHWRNDLSYGTYIYAFPVTQLLVLAGASRFGPLGLALGAGMATLLIAGASWFIIERPAISLKSIPRRVTRRAAMGAEA